MKFLLLPILLLCSMVSLHAQIKNADFETRLDSTSLLPVGWGFQKLQGFTASLDTAEKHSGKYAFAITNADSTAAGFLSISQVVPVTITGLKKIAVTVYIKTKDLKGSVAIWSQLWDSNNKQIGFQNSGMQGMSLAGNNDWKQYKLNLTVNKDVKKLLLGTYLAGTGSVWFDDYSIEESQQSNEPPTTVVTKYINEFIHIVKSNSIYKDSLNWANINQDIAEFSKGMKTIDDARDLTSYMMTKLRQAGDNHSFIQPPVVAEKYAAQNTSLVKSSSKLIGKNIGYIAVPAFGSVNQQAQDDFANDMQNKIRELDTKHAIDSWIVDLRANGGGNMYPMIAGLGPLAGDGILGYFVTPENKKQRDAPWFYNYKKAKNGSSLGVKIIKPYQIKNPVARIAVLIGQKTASSGEMTAISFIGRPNTRTFGQPSGGFTSANSGFKLSDGSMLQLAVSYTANRNKKEYRGKIQPEVIITEVAGEDATLKAAQEWLLK